MVWESNGVPDASKFNDENLGCLSLVPLNQTDRVKSLARIFAHLQIYAVHPSNKLTKGPIMLSLINLSIKQSTCKQKA